MANVKKYRCMNVGNCQTANENKTFEIAEGAEKICPDCKKDMIVEVKNGPGAAVIGGIVAGVAVVAIAACFFLGVFSGEKAAEATTGQETEEVDNGTSTDSVAVVEVEEVETVDSVPAVETPAEAEKAEPEPAKVKDGTTTAAAPANYLTGYALPYGLYTGPAKNGRPNGPNGDVKVTKSYSLDLHNGQSLQLNPGDKISRCKFVDGKLTSGMLERPDNTAKQITIGVN